MPDNEEVVVPENPPEAPTPDAPTPNGPPNNDEPADQPEEPEPTDPSGDPEPDPSADPKADPPEDDPVAEANALMYKDLEQYKDIKEKLGGDDETVLKFLEARTAFGKARAEALVVAAAKGAASASATVSTSGAGAGGNGGGATPSGSGTAKETPLVSREHAAAKEMMEKLKVDLGITDRSGKGVNAPSKPANFVPQYLSTDPWTVDVNAVNDNAEDLTAEKWNMVLRINKALHGFTIREKERDIKHSVADTRLAFRMRNPDNSGISHLSPVNNPGTAPSGPALYLPEFEVVDDSSISITEIKSDLQYSLAQNGFSSHTVEMAASGGAFGVSAGISSGLRKQGSTGVGTTRSDSEKEYFATYNFPRARVFMDELNLEVSPQCAQSLRELESMVDTPLQPNETQEDRNKKAEDALRLFQKHFGHVFATQFCLGGQLQSTKSASAIFSASEIDKADALKAAVAASFSSLNASGSSKYSYETQTSENKKEQKSSELSKLAWSARGGDTRLCANPPAWAATVGKHSNWRIIQQESVVPIHELIGRCKGWEALPAKLELIAQLLLKNTEATTGDRPWENRIRLEPVLPDGFGKLAYDRAHTDAIVWSPDQGSGELEECVFTVLNANINEKNPNVSALFLPALYAEVPLFLTASRQPSRDPDRGSQVPGLWVNAAGELRPETSSEKPNAIMRWSLRKSLPMGRWNSKYPHESIKDGDEVYVFCHSMMLGVFRDLDSPPLAGSPICWNPNSPTAVKAFSPAKNWWWAQAFDEGRTQGVDNDLVRAASTLVGNALAGEARARQDAATSGGVAAVFRAASTLVGNALAGEARARQDAATWVGAADEVPAFMRASRGLLGDPAPIVLSKYAGTEGSDMLARMAAEGFQPARFRVRFA